jgi:hypothetical protein
MVVFHDLQSFAWIEILSARDQTIAGTAEAVVFGETRLPVGRADIRKDNAVLLEGRTGSVIEPVLERALYRLT